MVAIVPAEMGIVIQKHHFQEVEVEEQGEGEVPPVDYFVQRVQEYWDGRQEEGKEGKKLKLLKLKNHNF